MKKLLVLFVLSGVIKIAAAQELFVPAEIQAAYDKETRNTNGIPGYAYFQNRAEYQMDVKFNPATGFLEGEADIIYYNNSADTLDYIVYRLYQNIFKKGINRDFSIGESDLHQGVEVYEIQAGNYTWNDKVQDFQVRELGTNLLVFLKRPLVPGGRQNLKITWGVQLPRDITIRMGQYGRTNWFVGYWYPQIAVYDDIVGWDMNPFTGSAEYYLDFNSYDVEITVPGKYMLWATGDLQNASDIYTEKTLGRLEKARFSDSVVHVVTAEDLAARNILNPRAQHTYHFRAEQVPDFAFACSASYLWDATSALVDTSKNRRTLVQAVYKKEAKQFDEVAGIAKQVLELFSNEIMGVPYPYSKMTAFQGGGGMEFPMMINDGDESSYASTVYLTAHEIGHSYFPFYVGTNESSYAFMDEGLISFLPRDVEPLLLDAENPFANVRRDFSRHSGSINQMPLMVRSYAINHYPTYRMHAYTRPANAFDQLRQYLGKEKFHAIIQSYIKVWGFKHPTPYDFFALVEAETGENLSWFWRPWFFELNFPDVGLEKDNGQIVVVNHGGLPVSVTLLIDTEKGPEMRFYDASVWRGRKRFEVDLSGYQGVRGVALDVVHVPDAQRDNNEIEVGE